MTSSARRPASAVTADPQRIGVAHDVDERLLDDAVGGRGDVGRAGRSRPSPSGHGTRRPCGARRLAQPLQGGPETEVVEHLRAQVGDQVAQRPRSPTRRLRAPRAAAVALARRRRAPARAAEREEHRGEPAGRAVVQVLGDPPTLASWASTTRRRRLAPRLASRAAPGGAGERLAAGALALEARAPVPNAIAPSVASAWRASSWSSSPNAAPSRSPVRLEHPAVDSLEQIGTAGGPGREAVQRLAEVRAPSGRRRGRDARPWTMPVKESASGSERPSKRLGARAPRRPSARSPRTRRSGTPTVTGGGTRRARGPRGEQRRTCATSCSRSTRPPRR